MRSKYLKTLVTWVLSGLFYLVLLGTLSVIADWIGVPRNNFVFLIVYGIAFFIVYGVMSVGVEALFERLNNEAKFLRSAHGGRDIDAEEAHETEGDLTTLFPTNDK